MIPDSRSQLADWWTRTARVLLACCGAVLAYSSGPPNGVTGRPGEGTCLSCHAGSSGSTDSSSLVGLQPAGYEPDSLYTLTLTVNYAGQRRWGFELTAVDAANGPAGELVVLDSTHTQYDTSQIGHYEYLKHTSAGTFPGQTGQASWTIGWRAPAAGAGTITFYWCCNAANNNNFSSGDTIIRDSLVVTEATGIGSEPARGRFTWRYSNPSRNRTVILYEGNPGLAVRIYSTEGQLVRALHPSPDGARLRVTWDGRDDSGRTVPESRYFIRLGTEVTSVVQVQLVR